MVVMTTTAEIIADLLNPEIFGGTPSIPMAEHLIEQEALRPLCPKCRGKRTIQYQTGSSLSDDSTWVRSQCPDCVDGKMSIERMAAWCKYIIEMQTFDMTVDQRVIVNRVMSIRGSK
jgi:hypothetical protein